jgi:hypothetical protein
MAVSFPILSWLPRGSAEGGRTQEARLVMASTKPFDST